MRKKNYKKHFHFFSRTLCGETENRPIFALSSKSIDGLLDQQSGLVLDDEDVLDSSRVGHQENRIPSRISIEICSRSK